MQWSTQVNYYPVVFALLDGALNIINVSKLLKKQRTIQDNNQICGEEHLLSGKPTSQSFGKLNMYSASVLL